MRSILVLATAATFAAGAFAQAVSSDKDHAAHHPAGALAPAKLAAEAAHQTAAAASAPSAGQMASMMKSMQDMHDKVMAAKTPEERQALMADHMTSMKDGMHTMGQMKGGQSSMGMGGMGAKGGMEGTHGHHDMMSQRMNMMELMMQMMMDREGTHSAPAK